MDKLCVHFLSCPGQTFEKCWYVRLGDIGKSCIRRSYRPDLPVEQSKLSSQFVSAIIVSGHMELCRNLDSFPILS